MKKFAVLFVMAMLLPLTACAQEGTAKWKEGTHYTVLDEEATKNQLLQNSSLSGAHIASNLSQS